MTGLDGVFGEEEEMEEVMTRSLSVLAADAVGGGGDDGVVAVTSLLRCCVMAAFVGEVPEIGEACSVMTIKGVTGFDVSAWVKKGGGGGGCGNEKA